METQSKINSPDIKRIFNLPNQCLVYYLMSSFLYYKMQTSVISDFEYDALAKILIDKWDEVTHQHKNLIDIDDLKAGTGYAISDYPKIIQGAACQWHKDVKGAYP